MSKLNFLRKIDRSIILIGIAVIGVVIVAVLISNNSGQNFSLPNIFGQSSKEIGQKAVDYINNNNLAGGTASLVNTSEESGLVKIKIKIGENEYDSYVTKDGKYLFPQTPIDMSKTETSSSASGGTAEEVLASIQKSDNPAVEAYVVSRCPFGLQMQRMIAEAVKNISVLANNIKVKYIGSVSSDGKGIESMHGAEEAAENLRQICIREEQPAKYWNYVSCQMKAQGTELSCEKSTGVDSAKLSACLGDPGRGVAFAKKDFETADQLGISGSPTLAINGKVIDEFTSDNNPVFGSSRSADEMKTTVCIASNSQPDFCSTNLDTAQAATSFSETYGSSGGSNSSSCQ